MSKTIIINEETASELKDMLTMTQYKFKANIRKFLAALLEDPTGAEPDMIFTQNGLDKNKLIKSLVDNKVITKKMTIDDHDTEGNPHTARMIVKYSVPKERFNERLDALYDSLFPNVEARINEDGAAGGGAAACAGDAPGDGGALSSNNSGQYGPVPLFGGITVRKKKKDKKSVGGNPYTLNEDILEVKATGDEVYQKYYSGIDRNVFNAAIVADPTAKNGGMGKYTKWILNLVKKGLWKPGDTSETRDCLERFAKIGAKLPKKDIQQYGSVGELYQALQDASGVKTRSEVKGEGAEKVYEDNDWVVIHPMSKEAAIYYGKGTKWCTAATTSNNMFEYYNEQGPLYIVISKRQPEMKWQFHVESESFMNVEDEQVGVETLSKYGNIEGLFKFIQGIDKKLVFFPKILFEKCNRQLKDGVSPKDIFDYVGYFGDNFTIVNLDDRFNLIKYNQLISERWFDEINRWHDGISRVKLNGKFNFINTDGELLSPKQWFDVAFEFYEGFAKVKFDFDSNQHKEYYLDTDGNFYKHIPMQNLTEAVTGEDGRKSSAVYAYVKNNNGEWCILAAKRIKNEWDDEGGKMNPPMGHRHKYESPEDGAVRECEEESGIKFDKNDLVFASKEDWGTNFKIYLPGKTSDYKPGEGDEENTKFRWIPVSDIDKYDWAWSCATFAKRFKPKK